MALLWFSGLDIINYLRKYRSLCTQLFIVTFVKVIAETGEVYTEPCVV